MKKIICLLTALCVLLSVGAIALAEDASLTAVTEKGEFILGLDDAFPPMGFRDENDNIVGFDIDVAAAVCEKLNVKLVCQPVDWSTKELELSSGAIDCIWNGFTVTDERLEIMDFTNAYLSNQQVLCVRADDEAAAIEDVYGRVLGYQSGSSAADLLSAEDGKLAANFDDAFGYDTYLMALMDLENGNVDAVLGDLTLLSYQIAQEANAGKFKVLDGSVSDEQFAIGMRKGDTALVEAVNNALSELAQEGVLAEISTKWFGSDITLINK